MKKIITLVCTLCFSHTLLAETAPKGCPAVADIKKGGIGSVISTAPQTYISAAVVPATKTLPAYWFYMGKFKAKDDGIAVKEAMGALTTLRGAPAPYYQDVPFFGGKKWVCTYQAEDVSAFATTG